MNQPRVPYTKVAFDINKYQAGRSPLDGTGYLSYFPWATKDCPKGRSVGNTAPIVVGNPSWWYSLGGTQDGIFPAFGGWAGTKGTSIHLPRACFGGWDDALLDELRRQGVDCYTGLGGPAEYVPATGGATTGRFDDDNGNPRIWFPRPQAASTAGLVGGDVYIYAPGEGDPGISDSSGTETITTHYVVTFNDGPGGGPPDHTETFGPFSPSTNTDGFEAIVEPAGTETHGDPSSETCSSYMNPFDPFDPRTYRMCGYYTSTVEYPESITYKASTISQPLYQQVRAAWAPCCRKFRIAGGETDFAGADFHGTPAQIAADIRAFFAR